MNERSTVARLNKGKAKGKGNKTKVLLGSTDGKLSKNFTKMETRQTLPAPPLPYLTRAIDQNTQRSQAATLAVLHSQPCPYCCRRSHPHTVDEELAGGDFPAVRPPLL